MPKSEPISLASPFTSEKVASLKLGRRVTIEGSLIACRGDALTALSADGVQLRRQRGLGLYNAAPLVVGRNGQWRVCSAGPSVSMRSESDLIALLERFRIHVVIGQGAMGPDMCRACAARSCVYLQTIGLAGVEVAQAIRSVTHANPARAAQEEDGPWMLEVERIEAIVAIDASGKSLHRRAQLRARRNMAALRSSGK
jgi:tartrate dehydratase beta subunit/fumarate hydratase class I family protein